MVSGILLMTALNEAANEMFDVPTAWVRWTTYFLEAIQGHADADAGTYEEFLRNLKGAITARLEDGR